MGIFFTNSIGGGLSKRSITQRETKPLDTPVKSKFWVFFYNASIKDFTCLVIPVL